MLFSYPSRVNSRMNVNVCCFQRNLFAASLSSFIPVQLPSRTETYLWYVLPDEVKSTSVLDRYFEILSPCERENVPQEECLASLCTCSYYHCKMMDDQVLLRFTPKNSDLIYYFSDMIGGTLTFFHEERARRCLETTFLFSIPMDGPMSFSTPSVSVQWALRFEFFTTPKNVDWKRHVLGTPTREEIRCMNPNYTDFRFPQINVFFFVGELNFGRETSTMRCLLNTLIHLAILVIDFPQENASRGNDLASRLLQYSPSLRCTALEACAHPFFDEFREPNARLPNGHLLPPLFNFKPELTGASPELINRLIPDHVKR